MSVRIWRTQNPWTRHILREKEIRRPPLDASINCHLFTAINWSVCLSFLSLCYFSALHVRIKFVTALNTKSETFTFCHQISSKPKISIFSYIHFPREYNANFAIFNETLTSRKNVHSPLDKIRNFTCAVFELNGFFTTQEAPDYAFI